NALGQHCLARAHAVGNGEAGRVVAAVNDAQAGGDLVNGLLLESAVYPKIILRLQRSNVRINTKRHNTSPFVMTPGFPSRPGARCGAPISFIRTVVSSPRRRIP